jgi:hypothetical protein
MHSPRHSDQQRHEPDAHVLRASTSPGPDAQQHTWRLPAITQASRVQLDKRRHKRRRRSAAIFFEGGSASQGACACS